MWGDESIDINNYVGEKTKRYCDRIDNFSDDIILTTKNKVFSVVDEIREEPF